MELVKNIYALRVANNLPVKYPFCQLGTMDSELLLFVHSIRMFYETTGSFHKNTPIAIKTRILQAFNDEGLKVPSVKLSCYPISVMKHGEYIDKKLTEINGLNDLYETLL